MSEPVNRTDLFKALFAVQAELQAGIAKTATNPHYKNDYADRTSILQTVLPVFQKHGLLLIQAPVPQITSTGEVLLGLATTIVHIESGADISSIAAVPLPKDDPQGYGSAFTYTSRYALTAILALPLLDDDGNAASGKSAAPSVSGKGSDSSGAAQTAASTTPKAGNTSKPKGGVWPKSGLTAK